MAETPTTTAARATPIAPYDATDDEAIQRTWGADAVFCNRCVPGMWHHRDYHRVTSLSVSTDRNIATPVDHAQPRRNWPYKTLPGNEG